jgi:hypothetical protein
LVRSLVEDGPEPAFGVDERRAWREAPAAAVRYAHERQPRSHKGGERTHVGLGVALVEGIAELSGRERAGMGEDRTRLLDEGGDVDPLRPRSEDPSHRLLERRRDRRAQAGVVAGGHQVERPAHQGRSDDPAVLDRHAQLARLEPS